MVLNDNWSQGYVVGTDYTFGYYNELNPLRMRIPLLSRGIMPPEVNNACELGFGQGISVNIHAAASGCQWHGTDFNVNHALFAQTLAKESCANCKLYDQSFAEFCQRPDLPDFDFVGIHGIWSWINHENQSVMVDFLRRKLKVGGVLYISYNTLPGWAPFLPFRELLRLCAEDLGGAPIADRIGLALDFGKSLLAANPLYESAAPELKKRLGRMEKQDRHYLAHEFFNQDWEPVTFAQMAGMLAPARLEFACSAQWSDLIDIINLSGEQSKFLAGIKNVALRETARDFMRNTQFRRDYWIKGRRKPGYHEQLEALRNEKIVLLKSDGKVDAKIQGSKVEGSLSPQILRPILNILRDRKAHSLGEIYDKTREAGLGFNQILETAIGLVANGAASPADGAASPDYALKLNSQLEKFSRSSGNIGWLACPLTGGGMFMGRIEQLLLLGIDEGLQKPEELAQYVWNWLQAMGEKVLKDGKPVENDAENVAMLGERAKIFIAGELPLLREWGVAR